MAIKSVQKAIYGNVAIHRAYCHKCKKMSFVIDSQFQCCLREVDVPERETKKRMAETDSRFRTYLSRAIKDRIIREQESKCIYCEVNLKGKMVHFDHFIPWHYINNDSEDNIVASCSKCNLVKSSFCFDTLDAARIYILNKRGLL